MRWFAAMVSAAVLGCSAPGLTQQQRAVEEQFVSDRMSEWTTALSNRVPEPLLAMYVSSAALDVVWPDGRRAVGAEEQQRAIVDFFNLVQQMNFVALDPDIDILAPGVALASFRHTFDLRFVDTRRELDSGHGTLVWTKSESDGLWRILRQHISINPPAEF